MKDRTKMILVVRKDLNMRTGKIAGQCAHAACGILVSRLKRIPIWSLPYEVIKFCCKKNEPLYIWLFQEAFTKICVYVNSEKELLEIWNAAVEEGVDTKLIRDAGRTEFHGEETLTCCAIGPDFEEKINLITGHLPLL